MIEIKEHGVYRRRDGGIVGPMQSRRGMSVKWPWGDDTHTWTCGGKFYWNGGDHAFDLIEEIVVGEGWKPWNGGAQPCDNIAVEVITQDGRLLTSQAANYLTWSWREDGRSGGNIAAYRVIPATVQAMNAAIAEEAKTGRLADPARKVTIGKMAERTKGIPLADWATGELERQAIALADANAEIEAKAAILADAIAELARRDALISSLKGEIKASQRTVAALADTNVALEGKLKAAGASGADVFYLTRIDILDRRIEAFQIESADLRRGNAALRAQAAALVERAQKAEALVARMRDFVLNVKEK